MKGIKTNCLDANGDRIYSGQRLKKKVEIPGEINLDFPLSWSKEDGFFFIGRRLGQYMLSKYVITKDVSWWDKIKPKFI